MASCTASGIRLILISGWMIVALSASAGQPTEHIRQTTSRILNILQAPEYAGEEHAEKRRTAIRQAVDQRFDWTAMAQRALGRHWRDKTDKQRQEFLDLFGKLLEARYMNKVENYSGNKVSYERETRDGHYAAVDATIYTETDRKLSVAYRMHEKDNEWLVYDVIIEGVSLVMNYRSQFNSILARSSFDTLLDKLRDKVNNE